MTYKEMNKENLDALLDDLNKVFQKHGMVIWKDSYGGGYRPELYDEDYIIIMRQNVAQWLRIQRLGRVTQ